MSIDDIIKSIVEDPNLKSKYWNDIKPELYNSSTLLRSNNKFLKSLPCLIDKDGSNPKILKEIYTNFKIDL
jgi:hypothetical protein